MDDLDELRREIADWIGEERETTRQETIDALAEAVGKMEAIRLADPDAHVRVQPSAEEETARDVLDAVWEFR